MTRLSPALCREYGDKFFALGWWEDALEFYQKGKITEGLEKLKAHCWKRATPTCWPAWENDPRFGGPGGPGPGPGKFHFARRAYEAAGDPDKTALAAGLIAGLAENPDR